MALGAHDDVDDGTIVEVRRPIERWRYATLVELTALFELGGDGVEESVVLDAGPNLLFVVERDVGRDGSRESHRLFGFFDQRHWVKAIIRVWNRVKFKPPILRSESPVSRSVE